MKVWFVVIDVQGAILRTGCCEAEDAPLQGELVLTLTEDPQLDGRTHQFDAVTETFVPIEA